MLNAVITLHGKLSRLVLDGSVSLLEESKEALTNEIKKELGAKSPIALMV